jgi:hypothetical protein
MAQLVWLVTGCSSGFGAEFVRQILERGDKVVATARRAETLAELENLAAPTLQLDVTDTEASIFEKTELAIGKYGRMDVLVNKILGPSTPGAAPSPGWRIVPAANCPQRCPDPCPVQHECLRCSYLDPSHSPPLPGPAKWYPCLPELTFRLVRRSFLRGLFRLQVST